MKRGAFYLFDSFTAGILFLLFTSFLFVMIPSFSSDQFSQQELVQLSRTIEQNDELFSFIDSGSSVSLTTFLDSSLPSQLCVNVSYYTKDGVYQDSAIKSECSSSTQRSVLYGSTYVDDIYMIKLEGWYE